MKLHLPIALRSFLLSCCILATTTPTFAFTWDPAWKKQGSKDGPDPAEVKKLTEENRDSKREGLSSDSCSDYQRENEDGSYTIAIDVDGAEVGDLCGGRSSYCEGSKLDGLHREIWINVTGSYDSGAYIVGGNYRPYDRSAFGNLTFYGNVHIQIGDRCDGPLIFGGNAVGGSGSSFIGNTYISCYSYCPSSIVGGSFIAPNTDPVGETPYSGKHVGNTYVNIYNVQKWRRYLYFDGGVVGSDGDIYYWKDEKEVWLQTWVYGIYDYITGGNYLEGTQGARPSEFIGDSHIVVDLSRRADLFMGDQWCDYGMPMYGGDSAYGFATHSWHKGDASLSITGADGVDFLCQVVAGSYNFLPFSSAQLDGSTWLSIDSGTYRHLVIGGMNSGERAHGDLGAAGRSILYQNSNVRISGGQFAGYAYSFSGAAHAEDEGKTLGSLALIGGNGVFGSIEKDALNVIGGNTDVLISDGAFSGHVVGATVVAGEVEDFSGVTIQVKGISKTTMTGGSMMAYLPGDQERDTSPRVVGGMILHTTTAKNFSSEFDLNDPSMMGDVWQSRYRDQFIDFYGAEADYGNGERMSHKVDDYEAEPGIGLGGTQVSISGSAVVYDVVGGSWVACEKVPGEYVEQGGVSVRLGPGATVRGNVYAAGIQSGEAAIRSASSSVCISAGVSFAREDDAPSVVSGGYLCADAQQTEQNLNPWYSWRDQASLVTGARSLEFDSAADYAESLAGVIFTNFDEVVVTGGAKVQVGALLITDTQQGERERISLTGGGELIIVPDQISITTLDKQADGSLSETARSLPNIMHTSVSGIGTTLHLAPSASTWYTGVQRIEVSQNGTLLVDLAPADDTTRRELRVSESLSFTEGGVLDLRIHVRDEMLGGATSSILKSERSAGATVSFDQAQISLVIQSMESTPGNEPLLIVLVDHVEGREEGENYTLTDVTRETLERWFGTMENVRLWVDEQERLVITADPKSIEPRGPHYHQDHAVTDNGRAGGSLLDDYFFEHRPQEAPDRDRVLESIFEHNVKGNTRESDRIQAAVAGSSLAVLGLAMLDDVERQLRLVRNRMTGGGEASPSSGGVRDGKEGLVHEAAGAMQKPAVWLNAEGDYRSVDGKQTEPGYRMNSWGGTLGAAYSAAHETNVGIALTAMYGKLTSHGPDVLKADTETYYLSCYAEMKSGKWKHSLIATGGKTDIEGDRTVNLGGAYGSYSTQSQSEGYLLGVQYELSYSIELEEEGRAILEPMVSVAWRQVRVEGVRESGSDAALRTGAQELESVTVGGGVKVRGEVMSESLSPQGVQLEGRAIVKYYGGDTRSRVDVGFHDRASQGRVKTRKYSNSGIEIGCSASLPLEGGRRSVFMDANAELREAYTNVNATLGYKVQF